jgi:hypothetical protein
LRFRVAVGAEVSGAVLPAAFTTVATKHGVFAVVTLQEVKRRSNTVAVGAGKWRSGTYENLWVRLRHIRNWLRNYIVQVFGVKAAHGLSPDTNVPEEFHSAKAPVYTYLQVRHTLFSNRKESI